MITCDADIDCRWKRKIFISHLATLHLHLNEKVNHSTHRLCTFFFLFRSHSSGFGLEEADDFRFVDCPLPDIPLSVILHRTALKMVPPGNLSLNSDGTSDALSTGQVISEVKVLKMQFSKVTNVSSSQVKTLFKGLESLEKLSLRNLHIDFTSEKVNSSQAHEEKEKTSTSKVLMKTRSERSAIEFLSPSASTQGDSKPGTSSSSENKTILSEISDKTLFKLEIETSKNFNTKLDSFPLPAPQLRLNEEPFSSKSSSPTFSPVNSSERLQLLSADSGKIAEIFNSTQMAVKDTQSSKNVTNPATSSTTTSSSLAFNASTFSHFNERSETSSLPNSTTKEPKLGEEPVYPDRQINKWQLNLQNASSDIPKWIKFSDLFPRLRSLRLSSVFPFDSQLNSQALKQLVSECQHLETVHLDNNELSLLLDHTFNGSAKSLRRLYLMSNKVKRMQSSSLASLSSLEILDLFDNNLTKIESNVFKDLISLSMLRIAKNDFTSLPGAIFQQLHALKSLNLNFNRNLTQISPQLLWSGGSIENVSMVDCSLVSLSEEPERLFTKAVNVQSIELRGNKLKNLTARGLFSCNLNLKKIDASYNDIEVISGDIFSPNSSNLLELNLYGNNLLKIDSSAFSYLRNLKVLKLGFNDLTSISADSFFSLRALEELDLSRNQLTNFNEQLSRLPFGYSSGNLKRINLSKNYLTDFNEFSVIDWSTHLKIEHINLSANKFAGRVTLPVFHSTAPYVVLDLSSNVISSINMDEIVSFESALLALATESHRTRGGDEEGEQVQGEGKERLDLFPLNNIRNWRSANYQKRRQLPFGQSIIQLDKNPLLCDCLLEPFVSYAKANEGQAASLGILKSVSFDLHSPNLKCSNGIAIQQVTPDNLTCRIWDERICPSSCSCIYRCNDSSATIDCSNQSLRQIPLSIVSPKNYANITIKVAQEEGKSDLAAVINGSGNISLAKAKADSPSTVTLVNKVSKVTLVLSNNLIDTLTPINHLFGESNLTFTTQTGAEVIAKADGPIDFEVYLDNNKIDTLPVNFLQDTHQLKRVHPDSSVRSSKETLMEPLMEASAATTAPTMVTASKGSLSLLSLRGNKLAFIPESALNNLDRISETLYKVQNNTAKRHLKLFLGQNPFNCTIANAQNANSMESEKCQQLLLKNWLVKHLHLVQDVGEVKCTLSNSIIDLIEAPDSLLCPLIESNTVFAMSITCLTLSFILVVISAIYYKNRQTILAFIYIYINPVFLCLNLVNEDDLDQEKLYDAFISYSSADRDIVMEMLAKLEPPSDVTQHCISFLQRQLGVPTVHEKECDQIVPESGVNSANKLTKYQSTHENESDGQYYTLCIHERDWLPGNLISWNIVNSVQNSRRTILIISKEFLNSIWFQVEFHTAYYQMLEDQIDRLIVIVRGELPPKEQMDSELAFLLTTKTYLVWGEKWFWHKLKYALPHGGRRNKDQRTKDQIMKEYVDQAINEHFQLHSAAIGELSHVNRAFVGETET